MKNKIIITTAFALLAFAVFYGTANASTIFTDDFESYELGNVAGQGNWEISMPYWCSYYTPQVQTSYIKQGEKAIKVYGSYLNACGIEKTGTPTTDGMITIYMEKFIGGSATPDALIELKQGDTVITSVKGQSARFLYYDGNWQAHINFGPFFSYRKWYAVQIQWRSSDHKIRYNIDGGLWTDWKPGMNQWTTGPDTVALKSKDGWIYYDTVQENLISDKNPVLIVPGITGTELWNGNELIWPDLDRMFWDIGDEFLTENLSLDANGNSVNSITEGDVIDELIVDTPIFGRIQVMDIFKDLNLDLQNESNYALNENLFFFPYDWRLDLDSTKDLLQQKIEEIKTQTGSSKVDIIAHSMGGLLSKAYIKSYGKDSIDKLIFIGTPHLGAPKAGKTLLEGDNFSIPWLDANRVKEVALNMPSLHQLLPNQTYFNEFQGYIKPYSFFSNPDFYDYAQTREFFVNEKDKNSIMFNIAEDFFSKNLDELDLSGIDTYNITGCKSSTQSGYKISAFGDIGRVGYSSGDGTVPFLSASYLNILDDNKYYVKNGSHSELPSTNGVRELILDILNNQSSTLSNNISLSSDFCNFKGKSMTWRSPVEVHIYDQLGNHTGPTENNGIEYGIPGADYEIINGEKFVFLPTDEGQEYAINGSGEDEGTFDLLISEIDNGAVSSTYVYDDISIILNSRVSFDISENSNDAVIEYDFENSGQFYAIEADAILDGNESQDLVPPETQIILTGKQKKDDSFVKDVLVELEATDNLSGVLKTWYSLDGVDFIEYTDSFVLEKKNVYQLYYYSTDRAGNNEEVKTKQILVGINQKQLEKCLEKGKCPWLKSHKNKTKKDK